MTEDFGVIGFIIGGVIGVILGGISGHYMAEDMVEQWNSREALRAECIAGNDRACRIYEVDHGDA